jgi:hypothetical protein
VRRSVCSASDLFLNTEPNQKENQASRSLAPTVPSKRAIDTSDLPVIKLVSPIGADNKRAKTELAPATSTPLAPVISPRSTPNTATSMDATDIRLKIQDVQTSISTTQLHLDRAKAKRNKTKSDLTRIARYERELAILRSRKAEYQTMLLRVQYQSQQAPPLAAALTPPGQMGYGGHPSQLHVPAQAAAFRGAPQPTAGAVQGPYYQAYHGTHGVPQSGVHYNPATFTPAYAVYSQSRPNVVAGSSTNIDSVPAAARPTPMIKSEPAQPDFSFPPVAKAPKGPVASGSGARIRPYIGESDDSMGEHDPYDDEDDNPFLAQYRDRIPHIPPMPGRAGDDDRFDDQGNYYGRGRDMFQGPRAAYDELVLLSLSISRFHMGSWNSQFNFLSYQH